MTCEDFIIKYGPRPSEILDNYVLGSVIEHQGKKYGRKYNVRLYNPVKMQSMLKDLHKLYPSHSDAIEEAQEYNECHRKEYQERSPFAKWVIETQKACMRQKKLSTSP